jgi:tetratricopeptide (TPR) repeat protein
MTTPDPDSGPDMLGSALVQMARGIDLPNFCAWYADHHAAAFAPGAAARTASPQEAEAEARRAATVLARELWRLTPDPAHGWRPRGLPQPGRNDPCFCGSGRKFKQCCQALAPGLPAPDIEPLDLAGLLFVNGPPSWQTPAALRAMPADTLAAATHAWGVARGPLAVVDLLEPVFLSPQGLHDKHDYAFDMLLDAMHELGLDARRFQLAEAVAARATSKALRCAAHCRLAALMSDQGDKSGAWTEFRTAQRISPDAPELLHLELSLLLSEERVAEAQARAPLLAARARKLGNPELADVLLRMGEGGLAAAYDGTSIVPLEDEEKAWIALLRAPITHLVGASFTRCQTVQCEGDGEDARLEIALAQPMARQLKPWASRFSPEPPESTSLYSDADALLDDPQEALVWLTAQPDCMATLTVLDDLLLAARDMHHESDAAAVLRAACDLAFAAAQWVEQALAPWPGARLPWIVFGNRPALRIVTQAIEFALETKDEARAMHWVLWMLARNPTDNHGWREMLRHSFLSAGDGAGALTVLDQYPGDAPPADHDRALALYLLGQREEAETTLRAAHAEYPGYVTALLPAALDRPPGENTGFVVIGSADHAWDWRAAVREAWIRAGALDWLRGLQLPDEPPVPRKKALPRARRTKEITSSGGAAQPARAHAQQSPQANLAVVQKQFGPRWPWLLGWLAAVGWAPAMCMPQQWMQGVQDNAAMNEATADVPGLIDAVMAIYNACNDQRVAAERGSPVPLPDAIPTDDDAGWTLFAAGFTQAADTLRAAGWRQGSPASARSGGPLAPLYQLARKAPPGPDGWRAADEVGGDEGQPLLALAGEPRTVRALLARALQPLWERALVARG